MKTLSISCAALAVFAFSSTASADLSACQETQKTKFLPAVRTQVTKECASAKKVSGYAGASFGQDLPWFQAQFGTPVVAPSFQKEGASIRSCVMNDEFYTHETQKRINAASSVILNYCQKLENAVVKKKKVKDLSEKEVLRTVSSKKLICSFEKAPELEKFLKETNKAAIQARKKEIQATLKKNPQYNAKSATHEVEVMERRNKAFNTWSKKYCSKLPH